MQRATLADAQASLEVEMRNGQGWLMDPHAKDYEQDLGAPVLDASLKMPIYFRTMVPRTQWLYAPNNLYGSDFWTKNRKQIQGTTTAMKAIQQRALRPLLQDG